MCSDIVAGVRLHSAFVEPIVVETTKDPEKGKVIVDALRHGFCFFVSTEESEDNKVGLVTGIDQDTETITVLQINALVPSMTLEDLADSHDPENSHRYLDHIPILEGGELNPETYFFIVRKDYENWRNNGLSYYSVGPFAVYKGIGPLHQILRGFCPEDMIVVHGCDIMNFDEVSQELKDNDIETVIAPDDGTAYDYVFYSCHADPEDCVEQADIAEGRWGIMISSVKHPMPAIRPTIAGQRARRHMM